MTLKFLGFAGSLRKNSYNRAALRAAQGLTPPEAALEAVSLALGHASVSFTEAQYALSHHWFLQGRASGVQSIAVALLRRFDRQ